MAQISMWMSRLQHLLRLHQMPKLLGIPTVDNAPTAETQTTQLPTQPSRNEVDSQATPLQH